jgi:hypothetical protein
LALRGTSAIEIWVTKNGEKVAELTLTGKARGSLNYPNELEFSDDNRFLYDPEEQRLWNIADRQPDEKFERVSRGLVGQPQFSKSNREFIFFQGDAKAAYRRVYDLMNQTLLEDRTLSLNRGLDLQPTVKNLVGDSRYTTVRLAGLQRGFSLVRTGQWLLGLAGGNSQSDFQILHFDSYFFDNETDEELMRSYDRVVCDYSPKEQLLVMYNRDLHFQIWDYPPQRPRSWLLISMGIASVLYWLCWWLARSLFRIGRRRKT